MRVAKRQLHFGDALLDLLLLVALDASLNLKLRNDDEDQVGTPGSGDHLPPATFLLRLARIAVWCSGRFWNV